jgi:hypothetical protein
MFSALVSSYGGALLIVRRYWRFYGGWKALFASPFFHIALILTLTLSHYWMHEAWWDVTISVLPNIIGFALGGYAIWLGFGDEKFRNLISEQDDPLEASPYLQVSATFAHFIVVQIVGLVVALIAKATNFDLCDDNWIGVILIGLGLPIDFFKHGAPLMYGLGFLLFAYALMTALAATFAIFRVAFWFDEYRNSSNR